MAQVQIMRGGSRMLVDAEAVKKGDKKDSGSVGSKSFDQLTKPEQKKVTDVQADRAAALAEASA